MQACGYSLLPSALRVVMLVQKHSTKSSACEQGVDASNPPAVQDWGAEIRGASLVPGVTGKTINGVYSGMEPESKFLEAEPAKA
eukprot:1152281-Pelagomonas_calceolata.AAC.1